MSVYQDIIHLGDQSPIATIVTDSQRRVEYVNRAFTELCGHLKSEVLGKNPGEVLQGHGTSPESKLAIRRALQEGKPFSAKILNYHKDSHSYITGLYILPFQDRSTGLSHFLALERELPDWEADLLDDPHFAMTLAGMFSLIND